MIGLSHSTGYGVRALTCLGVGSCETRFVRDIARCADVPPSYLSKVFTKLAHEGIILTKRGWKGGIELARPASEISLLDIVLAIEGEEWIAECLLTFGGCENVAHCPTHAFWQEERQRIEAELSRTTLADIVEFERKRSVSQSTGGGCACSASARTDGAGSAGPP